MMKPAGKTTLFLLSTLMTTPVLAGTITATTSINGSNDTQGPVNAGSVNVFNVDAAGDDFDFSASAFAHAAGDANGNAAVRAEGLYACGSCSYSLLASTTYSVSYTNNTAADVGFDYDYFIDSLVVEHLDYAFSNEGSGLQSFVSASIELSTTGGFNDSLFASMNMLGGDASHTLNFTGSAPSFISDGGIFGYSMAPMAGTMSGSLAPGETVTVTTVLMADVDGFGFEHGSRAYIGDPNNLSAGSNGVLMLTAAVPVPAAVWLFASGLLGLVAVARHSQAIA